MSTGSAVAELAQIGGSSGALQQKAVWRKWGMQKGNYFEVRLDVRSVDKCWVSADNSLLVVAEIEILFLYDSE